MQVCGHEIEPIIGLEVHVQLATRTKLFCGCAVEFAAEPNSRTCPVCLGLPGALPVLNRRAVELALRLGIALGCKVAGTTRWDRKSYYYPDLPKNYQISQYAQPLCEAGAFEFPHDGRISRIRIRRAHLEEDAGKLVHDLRGITAVDLNRTGTPLVEIVTEPDLHSADEARAFAVQLQRLVRYLGVSEANMQKGQMRFEPNINVRIEREGEVFRTPIVEVKNLNSFAALHGAIEYEIRRQVEQWLADGETEQPGNKTNRGWDDQRGVTVPQREKEEAHDYRYFPDPDLVPLVPDPRLVEDIRTHMPEPPAARIERFVSEYKLDPRDAPALVECRATADLLDHAAEHVSDRPLLARQFLSFWAREANRRGTTIAGLGIPPQRMVQLATLVIEGRINATAASTLAEKMAARADELLAQRSGGTVQRPTTETCFAGFEPVDEASLDPAALAQQLGLIQSRDEEQIATWVDQALAANEKAVQDALNNPRKARAARGFLTGQVMKLSQGRADPKLVGRILEQRLAGLAKDMPKVE